MRVSTAMILDVVDRPGDPFVAMRRLLTDNHEPRKRQLRHILGRRSASPASRCCRPGCSSGLDEPRPIPITRPTLPADRRPAG